MTSPRRHLLRRALLCAALVGCTAPETGDAGADAADDVARVDGGRDVGERAAGFDTLFVGNSYVYVNDVAGHYRAAVGALSADVRVEEVTTGGYTLAQHAADARTDGTPLALALRRERAFDYVVLQEQSELGGYRNAGLLPERAESIAAALELASLARARDATVVLYQTWGREVGIPALGFFGFGTYPSMQDRLDYGYLDLATVLADQGIDVRIAPVGGAFRIVFDDLVREGVDPAAEGSDFDALYEPDGSHPSLRGAYLAACVIAGTVSRADVRTFADDPALGAEISARLRAVCARALAEPRWEVPAVSRPDEVMSGTTVGEMLGVSVAMSGDGLRLLFGSSADLVRVRARTTEGWIDEAEWGGATGFTDALALSSDGARALVGPPTRFTCVAKRAGARKRPCPRHRAGPHSALRSRWPSARTAAGRSWVRAPPSIRPSQAPASSCAVEAPGRSKPSSHRTMYSRDAWAWPSTHAARGRSSRTARCAFTYGAARAGPKRPCCLRR